MLDKHNFDGDNVPIVQGSALCALNGDKPELGQTKVLELMEAVDSYIAEPERDLDKVRHNRIVNNRYRAVTNRFSEPFVI